MQSQHVRVGINWQQRACKSDPVFSLSLILLAMKKHFVWLPSYVSILLTASVQTSQGSRTVFWCNWHIAKPADGNTSYLHFLFIEWSKSLPWIRLYFVQTTLVDASVHSRCWYRCCYVNVYVHTQTLWSTMFSPSLWNPLAFLLGSKWAECAPNPTVLPLHYNNLTVHVPHPRWDVLFISRKMQFAVNMPGTANVHTSEMAVNEINGSDSGAQDGDLQRPRQGKP